MTSSAGHLPAKRTTALPRGRDEEDGERSQVFSVRRLCILGFTRRNTKIGRGLAVTWLTVVAVAGSLGHNRRAVWPENQVGLVLVMASTVEGHVRDRGGSLSGIRLHVVEFQERSLRASPSGRGDESALCAVASPDRALDLARDMP